MPDEARAYLGKTVTVKGDRPLGSRHPAFPELRYPITYGYAPETVAGDGEPIDAYIVGAAEPVAGFCGVVIALVVRTDDDEDKLVVAPMACGFSAVEIERLVKFQDRFLDRRVAVPPGGADP